MPTPGESSQPKTPEGSNAPAYHPDLDEQLHGAWQKYGKSIAYAAGLILVFYVCKGAWEYFRGQHEVDVQQEFAAAKTPDQLKAFVGAHPDHRLAALAELQVADDSYASGQLASAVVAYRQVIPMLKGDALLPRAEIGLGMSEAQSGQVTEGEADLRKVFDDGGQMPVIRSEAGYELESLMATEGKSQSELLGVASQLQQIDAGSPWTQRGFSLAMTSKAKAPAATAPASAPSGISFKPPGK